MGAGQSSSPEADSSFRVFLIADVRGYTSFTRMNGDAAAARLAKKFAWIAREAVAARSGQVIELRGDEALAVFDSPAQAVRAALELQAACAEETEGEPGLPLNVGVGIDAGEAVPVEGGFRGAALNMAARLCSFALGGEVLVTSMLAAQAIASGNGDFEVRPHADGQFKGIDEPVEVLRAVDRRSSSVMPFRSPVAGASSAGGELVGRDEELHWLGGTWRTCRRGRGRVVFVSGPAGIGKSRLAAEVAELVAAGGGDVVGVAGGGDAAARASRGFAAAAGAERPTLVVVDDLEPIADWIAEVLDATFDALEARPVLVLVLAAEPEASKGLAHVLERADARGDGHRRLSRLTNAEVAEIAKVYAGLEIEDVPLDAVVRSSGGVPAAVHHALLDWARSEAARRLAAAAEWLAAGRARRAGDLDFANNVIRLRLDRLFDTREIDAESADCPYKGLAPFDAQDAATFFGREQLVGELAARSVGFGLLTVLGVSGSGKSSVVQAGLLPSLAAGLLPGSDRWAHIVFRPGEHPAASLDHALATAPLGERLVLVVDQFEEVFTICDDERQRSMFAARLVELADAPEANFVVLTIRDDFYGRCAAYPGLAKLLEVNHVLVPPMTRDELGRASELPARRAGVRLESALVDALVDDATEQPGALPLLSSALVELWRTRQAGWISRESYGQIGGISGAVARLAEESFSRLDGPQREAARAVLLRLAGGEDADTVTRRRVPFAELDLEQNPDAAAVVARFTDDRLLTAGESTVEVAHEALLREWPRLRDWLDEDAEGRRLRVYLTQAAAHWEQAGRDPAELFRGARLSATLDWTATHGRELNTLEREFVAASRAAGEQDARRQRRINRRLRSLLTAAAVLLVAAAVAGAVALVQRSHARRSATTAEAQRLGAQALTVTPPDQSFLYARESYNLDPSPATRGYLFAAEERSPAAIAVLQPLSARIRAMLASPDRSRQLVMSNEGNAAVVDSRTLKTERLFALTGVVAWAGNGAILYRDPKTQKLGLLNIASGRFSADRRLPASAYSISNDGHLLFTLPVSGATIGVVDLKTMNRLRLIRPARGFSFYDVEPEQGGSVVAVESSSTDPTAPTRYLVWRHQLRGAPSRTVLGGAGLPPFLPYAVGGNRFAVPVGRGFKIVDLESGRSSIIGSELGGASTLALSPDGSTLVLARLSHSDVSVVRVSDGTVENTFVGHQSQIHGVTFNPAGTVVFTAGADGRMIAWDLAGTHSLSITRRLLRPAPQDNVALPTNRLFAGSAHARLVVAVLGDGTVQLLAATAPAMPVVRSIVVAAPGKPGQPISAALDPSGRTLAVGTDDGRIIVFQTATGNRLFTRSLPPRGGHPTSIVAVAVSRAGLLAAAAADGRVARFSRSNNAALPLIDVAGRNSAQVALTSIAFTRDGARLAVVFNDGQRGTTAVYDSSSGKRRFSVQIGTYALAATFTPDGKTLIGGDNNGIAHFWDAENGKTAAAPILVNQGQVNSLDVDATGRTLVVGGTDGATWLFDLATHAQIGTPLGADASTTTASLFAGPADATPVTLAFPNEDPTANPVLTRWNIRAGFLAARACSVARRNLTPLEWQQILPNLGYRKVCSSAPLTQ